MNGPDVTSAACSRPLFFLQSSRQFTLTDYAVNRSGTIHYHEPKM